MVTNVKPAIKKQYFNSYLEEGEERPTEPDYAVSASGRKSMKRIKWQEQQKRSQEVTLKAEPQISMGRQRDARCAAEEWLNQWKVWAGNTLRLQINKDDHTVRGDGTSQKRKAGLIDPAQTSSSTRDTDVSCYGPSNDLGKGTGTTADPGSRKNLCDSKVRMESKREITKSHSSPQNDGFKTPTPKRQPSQKHLNGDITSSDYNGELINPKAEGFRQRLKDKKFRRRAEVKAVRFVDKMDDLRSYDRHPELTFSTICAESEVVRCDSNKRTTSGIDTRGKRIHKTTHQNKGIHHSIDTRKVGTPEPSSQFSNEPVDTLNKKKMTKIKKQGRNTKRQQLIQTSINDGKQPSQQEENEISSDKEHIHLKLELDENCEGNKEPRSCDKTINRWCRELSGTWIAESRRINREEELLAGLPPQVSNSNKNSKPRDLKHKTRIIEMTMMLNGIEQKITNDITGNDSVTINQEQTTKEATSDDTTPANQETDSSDQSPSSNWDLKGKSIDEILAQVDRIKLDPNIPMPHITADSATIEDFLQYSKNHPDAQTYIEYLDNEETEKLKDESSLLYLQEACTNCLHEARPVGFPTELWPYVFDTYKPHISGRWAGYDPNKIPEKINRLTKELRISQERPYAHPYFLVKQLQI